MTLAGGMGAAAAPADTAAVPVQPFQREESVGENTFGSTAAGDADEGITSPGVTPSLHPVALLLSFCHECPPLCSNNQGRIEQGAGCAGDKVDRLVGGTAAVDPEAGGDMEPSWVSFATHRAALG